MNGITYYRLQSDYDGDVTRNCGLTGQEIDNNFYVLEGRDVKSLEVDGDDITIILYNGDRITAEDALSGYAKDLSFDFDKESGTLTITQNGETTVIDGFGCGECGVVFTDSTLVGDGTKENPLGISPMEQTGHYQPVLNIIDETNGQSLPEDPSMGDRYIVKNVVSNYGYLYDYHAVAKIACMLKCNGSDWHIPTLKEWNDMLNGVDSTKNHDNPTSSVYLGEYAGKLLKTATATEENPCGWLPCDNDCDGQDNNGCHCGDNATNSADGCTVSVNPCMSIDCHHEQLTPSDVEPESTDVTECREYNFITPNGYADDSRDSTAFGKRARFWTASMVDKHNAWMKGFDYCHNGVYQEIVATTNYMSLMLVKDFNGYNYYGSEDVLGQVVETIMLPGGQIWTKTNLAIEACPCTNGCKCHQIKPNVGEDCDETSYNYIIAEWDGLQWIYKVIGEGEIVTVLEDYVDYKIINGELVPNGADVADDLEAINERIDGIVSDLTNLTGRVVRLEGIVGDNYDTSKGTISGRLDAIENKLSRLLDFNDRNNDDVLEPDEPYTPGEDGGGDGIKVGENEQGPIYW